MMRQPVLILSALLLGLALPGAEKPLETKAVSSEEWSLGCGSGAVSNYYTIGEDSIVASNNHSIRGNFAVREDANAIGDYTVSVSGTAVSSWPVTKNIHIGLVPWYVDANNYLLVYMEWSNTERPSSMRVVEFTGRINGQNPFVYKDGGFIASEWNDAWMDGGNTSKCVEPSSSWTFSVSRKRSAGGDADELFAYINGQQVGFFSFRDLQTYAAVNAKVGLYAYNEDVTFTDFSVTSLSRSGAYSSIEDGVVGKGESGTWSKDALGYSLDASLSQKASDNMLIKENEFEESNYAVTTSFASSSLPVNGEVGLVAWYQDEYNYVLATIKRLSTGYLASIKGQIANVTAPGNIAPTAIEETTSLSLAEGDIALTVRRLSSTLDFSINGESRLQKKLNEVAGKGRVGLCLAGASLTLPFHLEESAYVPFNWYSATLAGSACMLSSQELASISYESGVYHFSSASLGSEESSYAGVLYPSNKWEDVTVSAKFLGVTAARKIGLYAFYQNEDNFARIIVTSSSTTLEIVREGVSRSKSFYNVGAFEGDLVLRSTLKSGLLSLEIGEDVIFEKETLDMDYSFSPYVGFLNAGTEGDVSAFSVTGFSKGDTIVTEDGWSLTGPRPSTWTFSEGKKTLDASYEGGTEWQRTSALFPQEEASFHMGAEIAVTGYTAAEYKTGLVPYYLDSGNYVFVWFSQWSGATPKINVTARVKGAVLGGTEFHEVDAGVDYLGSKNQMEVEIDGDDIRVYINSGASPSYSGTFPGLSSRSLSGAKVGFNIVNTSARFTNFTLQSDKRIFTFDEAPVIGEIGTRPTTGVVGKNIKLPVYTATNSRNDPIDAVVKVFDPNGNEVTLTKNAFVPEIAGDYTVKVDATDDYGNQAETLQYVISVADAETSSSSETPDTSERIVSESDKDSVDHSESSSLGGETETPAKKGCGGSVVAASSFMGLILALGAAIAIKKRK